MPLTAMRTVVVTAPSRLHFGMFSFGDPRVRQFGGVGAMIQLPGVRVSIRPHENLTVVGVHAERARRFAEAIVANLRRSGRLSGDEGQLRAGIDVQHAPREHIGLGLGTQLGLSIAAAICAACDVSRTSATELATLAGRGARSAIGTHGFERGGLLVEVGKYGNEISPLIARLDLPSAWRFLLIMPRLASGLAGADEQKAFARLPAVPLDITDRLVREILLHLLPAAATADFGEFSSSLYRFGQLAGTCFAREQHGAFADVRTAQLIEHLRRIGVEGVGQSSWGPTVFALCENEAKARELREALQSFANPNDYDCMVTPPADQGAMIEFASHA